MAGALPEAGLADLARAHGLVDGRIVAHHRCFEGSPVADAVAAHLDVHGVTFRAVRRRA